MNSLKYNNQVRLLLRVLPSVAQESCIALHGGTAMIHKLVFYKSNMDYLRAITY